MVWQRIVLVAVLVLALAGWVVNLQLTAMHTTKAERPAWFAGACTPEDNATYNCKEVLKSRWAVFSPVTWSFVDPDPETGKQEGIPVAILGWFYFTGVLLWYLLVGRVDYARRFWHQLLLVVVLGGCAVSAFFVYVLYTKMDIRCFWCLVAHGLNFAVLLGTILLYPRKGSGDAPTPSAESEEDASPAVKPAHPSDRLIVASLLCIAISVFAELNVASRQKYAAVAGQQAQVAAAYKREIDRIQEDADTQFAWFKGQKRRPIELHDDDPFRGAPADKPGLNMVVFSDFECPHCARFAATTEKKIDPILQPYLRVYWKHMPWCKACNPYSKYDLHPNACRAGFAAEAARMQGGSDAFWKAHDYLFEHRAKLAQLDYGAMAKALGLDAERLQADMTGEAVKARVLRDIELAKKIGVRGTPAVYLDGRLVPTYMLGNQYFLKAVRRDLERQLSGKGADEPMDEDAGDEADATPDNPDQPDVP